MHEGREGRGEWRNIADHAIMLRGTLKTAVFNLAFTVLLLRKNKKKKSNEYIPFFLFGYRRSEQRQIICISNLSLDLVNTIDKITILTLNGFYTVPSFDTEHSIKTRQNSMYTQYGSVDPTLSPLGEESICSIFPYLIERL